MMATRDTQKEANLKAIGTPSRDSKHIRRLKRAKLRATRAPRTIRDHVGHDLLEGNDEARSFVGWVEGQWVRGMSSVQLMAAGIREKLICKGTRGMPKQKEEKRIVSRHSTTHFLLGGRR